MGVTDVAVVAFVAAPLAVAHLWSQVLEYRKLTLAVLFVGVYLVMKARGVDMDKEYASVFPLIFSIIVFLFACQTSIGDSNGNGEAADQELSSSFIANDPHRRPSI
ncbi:hypothetical protein LWI28_008083 [Acer negundo]|uniref:Uncharacterized protein n=1 Tax=Acer negundo TaxID=4023 RepID=A0AAD5NQZ4_ACENE|nr:hypothetical protein LWI28_008083 [Acer negundo]